MPADEEERARAFYARALGMTEIDFRPALKAHPALRCANLAALEARLESAGLLVTQGGTFEDGMRHAYVADPFGNRLELIG